MDYIPHEIKTGMYLALGALFALMVWHFVFRTVGD